MRVILWILGQPQTTKSSSAPKQATAVQGEAEVGFFRKSIKSTHSPTANLRILGDNARHCERSEAIHKSGLPRLASKARNDKKGKFLKTPEI